MGGEGGEEGGGRKEEIEQKEEIEEKEEKEEKDVPTRCSTSIQPKKESPEPLAISNADARERAAHVRALEVAKREAWRPCVDPPTSLPP